MTGQDLWKSILRHAISGKLVPQDPRDEPASHILDKIAKEKKQLLKEGKLKKKDLASSTIYRGDDGLFYERIGKRITCIQDQIPFDIPDSWCWVRLGQIYKTTSGGTPRKRPGYYDGDIPWFRSGEIGEKYISHSEVRISEEAIANSSAKIFPAGSLLVTMYCETMGQASILKVDAATNQAICALNTCDIKGVNTVYLYYFFHGFRTRYQRIGFGSAQPNISQTVIRNTLFPLPPEGEQERIVERLEEMKELVDIYGRAYAKRETLDADLRPSLRRGVLEEAIRGRLVEQRSEEGSAEPLLAQIEQEKSQLLKAGKLKKRDLTSSTIYRGDDGLFYERVGKCVACIQDQIPFDIPSSWHWTRLHSVLLPMETKKPSSEFLYIDVAAVNNKKNTIDNAKLTAPADAPSRASRKVREGDVLFSTVRPYLRNVALVTKESAEAIASTGFYVMSPATALCSKFLFYSMLSPYVINGLTAKMKGDNSPSVNNSDVSSFLFPLPPEGEQRRIVERLDKLMAQIDRL